MKRTLVLKREALADLSFDELASVAGGIEYSGEALTCPLLRCVGPITLPPSCYSFPWC